ncbi:DMT family transporter [Fulvimarina sp. 2208YS6-2-32]|uniref:DMT family transporter n=1 Tax=Fulvimarina uroteuthidis TaxID=3098149 RepID=A0ABU5HWN2_9HYPH|nr:DMT family transporter [Fulvimarina sp. 2208YS6-2-32]MDY8107552.1 DMT family transporter [Fulvimarina sp. 2208YS6-2-32]
MVGLATKANEDRVLLGIGMMLVAYFAFSGIDTSAKWLGLAGFPALQIAFMRYLTHFVISAGVIAKDGLEIDRFRSHRAGLVVLRGGFLMASTIANFIALRYLPLTLTATIMFSAPIFICALSWSMLGERVGPWRWGAILVGFFGIMIAIRPFDADFHWAVFLSLFGAVCMAFYTILTRKLAGSVHPETMQFYSGLVGTLAIAPFAFVVWQMPEDWTSLTLLLIIGGFGWFGHELLTRAHSYADASALTPFSYVFIVYLTISSIVFFDEWPDAWTMVGAVIVAGAGLVIWFREQRQDRKRRALLLRPPS